MSCSRAQRSTFCKSGTSYLSTFVSISSQPLYHLASALLHVENAKLGKNEQIKYTHKNGVANSKLTSYVYTQGFKNVPSLTA